MMSGVCTLRVISLISPAQVVLSGNYSLLKTSPADIHILAAHLAGISMANTQPQLVHRVQQIVDFINSTPLKLGTEYIDIFD